MRIATNNPKTLSIEKLPRANEFPAYPASWYWLGTRREFSAKPKSVRLFGRDLVAYRDDEDKVVVMDARCSHMGADLSQGTVEGGQLKCPFHGWKYGADGRCVSVPNTGSVPGFARQRSYAVEERNGCVYIFNGARPLFPMPFFYDEDPAEYVRGRPFSFNAKSTWYMISAHAFDVQHFETVHDRKLLGPPVIDCPTPFSRRCTHHSEVAGNTIYDRLLRRFVGSTVTVQMTIWGNNFCMVEGRFKRATSRFFLMMTPLDDGTTQINGTVFRKRSKIPLLGAALDRVGLEVRRWFTAGYLNDENVKLGSPVYRPSTMVDHDAEVVAYFHWALALCHRAES
jgi:nitrite reductase/ring-hydroxylating ferredoxin subunit